MAGLWRQCCRDGGSRRGGERQSRDTAAAEGAAEAVAAERRVLQAQQQTDAVRRVVGTCT